ncbi:MAG TPA: hypothetical protein VF601_04200 [Beijerinckiaceae bacterium]|jgi:hypothetical protein
MRKLVIAVALATCGAALLPASGAQAQGYAPWPPPPGMSADDYAARYGHAIQRGRSGPGYHDPRYQDPRAYPGYRSGWRQDSDWRRERHGPAYDPSYRGRYGRSVPGQPAPPAGMTWQEYEAHRAGSGGG